MEVIEHGKVELSWIRSLLAGFTVLQDAIETTRGGKGPSVRPGYKPCELQLRHARQDLPNAAIVTRKSWEQPHTF